ncbi:M28 family metallopeptidase [Nocardioides sp. SYSU D00038]|uniref:M28 family metallopeptidase n=1 Tax=Nocardioides sp. SYSU D00038 TaxID=2812554 RepID=UPI001966F770|nr:M28 family peptidase [Nocardioides sp. SYSU D00038]
MTRAGQLLVLAVLAAGCSADSEPEPPAAAPTVTAGTPSPSAPSAPPASPPVTQTPTPRADPDAVRAATAMSAVRHLASGVGPRPGTSPAYFRAAGWVQRRLEALGWRVERQRFPTPGGVSWGVPVAAGPSVNLVATRGDVRPGRPWLAVGAHLDTVPQAPGAEDNASGVGVLLAVAEAVAGRRTRLPVVLVAYGSEEPRGPSDDDHHYGSRAHVASLTAAQRRTLRGMVSLDRVGVGDVVPVGSVAADDPLRPQLMRAARRAGVPVLPEVGQRSSDHWSFVRAGLPGIRLGSTPYAGYHSAADVPSVVDPAQLRRTARLVVAWLR